MPVAALDALIQQYGLGALRTGVVLIVDDEEDNVAVMEAILADAYTVVTAASASEALALLERLSVDIVVTDQRMPGGTGVELLARVRERRPDVAGVIVTAHTDTPTVIAAINQAGAYRFLAKPWTVEVLLSTLAQASEHVYLTRAVHRLVNLLAEHNRTLTRTLTDLEAVHQRLAQSDRLATMGQLAAGVTHDLRNALTGLVLVGDELAAAPVPPAVRESFDVGLEGVRSLLNSLTGLLRFAGSGGVSVAAVALAPGDIVRDAVALVRTDRRCRERTFVVQVADDLPMLHGDRSKLGQVILNLLRNAFDATQGHTRVLLQASVGETRETVVLAVEDEGPGIAPAIVDQLFEAFASTKGDGGVGLGLFMARLLVNAQGGRLVHKRPTGGGTRFEVHLPAEPVGKVTS